MPDAVWTNFISGSLTSGLASITAGQRQTMLSNGLEGMPTIVDGTDRAKVVLDPFGVVGTPELVYVVIHTSGSNSATIERIAGQLTRAHDASEQWVHGPTANDFDEFQLQLDNQFQTTLFTAPGDILGSTAAQVPDNIPIGSEWRALTVDTAQPTKVQYRAIPYIVTSSTRPTQAQGAFVGMHIFESDTLHTLACITVDVPTVWQYVSSPPGTIRMTGGATVEVGEVWCDGTAYDSVADTTYAGLFAIIGNQFGGSDATDFVVPDLRSKFVYGWNPATGGAKEVAGARGNTRGDESKTIAIANMPSHQHGAGGNTSAGGVHGHSSSSGLDGGHTHSTVATAAHSHASGPYQFIVGAIANSTIFTNSGGNIDHSPAWDLTATAATNNAGSHSHGNVSTIGNHNHPITVVNSASHQHGIPAQGGGSALDVMPPTIHLGYAIRK